MNLFRMPLHVAVKKLEKQYPELAKYGKPFMGGNNYMASLIASVCMLRYKHGGTSDIMESSRGLDCEIRTDYPGEPFVICDDRIHTDVTISRLEFMWAQTFIEVTGMDQTDTGKPRTRTAIVWRNLLRRKRLKTRQMPIIAGRSLRARLALLIFSDRPLEAKKYPHITRVIRRWLPKPTVIDKPVVPGIVQHDVSKASEPFKLITKPPAGGFFSGDPFINTPTPPAGMSYEWKILSVMGHQVNGGNVYKTHLKNGWRAVPGSRHPEYGIKGRKSIDVSGMRLMERPQSLTNQARAEDFGIAAAQVNAVDTAKIEHSNEIVTWSVRKSKGSFKIKP